MQIQNNFQKFHKTTFKLEFGNKMMIGGHKNHLIAAI